MIRIPQDFQRVDWNRVFADLGISAGLAWASYFLACLYPRSDWVQGLLIAAFILLFCRALSFNHEVVHLEAQNRRLGTAFQVLLGIPARLPLYLFRLHLSHHSVSKFGTSEDPEHLNLVGRNVVLIFLFKLLVEPLLSPLLLLFRYCVITPLYWVLGKPFRDQVFQRFSAIHFEPGFVRKSLSPKEARAIIKSDLLCFLVSVLQLGAALTLSSKWLWVWAAGVAALSSLSFLRTVMHHNYTRDHRLAGPGRLDQMVSVTNTVENSRWTHLLAPILAPFSFRFHVLHHLHPGIPYLQLERAENWLRREGDPKTVRYLQSNRHSGFGRALAANRILKSVAERESR